MAEWKEPYVAVEVVTTTSVTRLITLPRRYHPGQGDLVVYCNGIYAVPNIDYREVTPYTIEFTEDLPANTVVTAHYQKLW